MGATPSATQAPAESRPATTESAAADVPKPAKKKKKSGGCLRGCLIFLLALLFVAGVIATVVFRLPQKMGWLKGPSARFTAMTHERLTAREIVAEAESKGFRSEGVQVYVFPKPDADEAVLYAVFDVSKGADMSGGRYGPVLSTLVLLGSGEKMKEHAVTHVGAEFRDEGSNLLFTAVATTADIRELVDDKITEAEFMRRVDRVLDLPNLARRSVLPF